MRCVRTNDARNFDALVSLETRFERRRCHGREVDVNVDHTLVGPVGKWLHQVGRDDCVGARRADLRAHAAAAAGKAKMHLPVVRRRTTVHAQGGGERSANEAALIRRERNLGAHGVQTRRCAEEERAQQREASGAECDCGLAERQRCAARDVCESSCALCTRVRASCGRIEERWLLDAECKRRSQQTASEAKQARLASRSALCLSSPISSLLAHTLTRKRKHTKQLSASSLAPVSRQHTCVS